MKCEKCGNEHDGSFGSGRFCNRKCANGFNAGRKYSPEARKQMAESLKKYYQEHPVPKQTLKCDKCGNDYLGIKRDGRKQHCENCRIKRHHHMNDAESILKFSKRTVEKILRRAKIGCSICSWDEAVCDIHHIKHKSHGGTDGHQNLIVVCPNCHRKIHCNLIAEEQLFGKTIADTFKDWKRYYDPRNKHGISTMYVEGNGQKHCLVKITKPIK